MPPAPTKKRPAGPIVLDGSVAIIGTEFFRGDDARTAVASATMFGAAAASLRALADETLRLATETRTDRRLSPEGRAATLGAIALDAARKAADATRLCAPKLTARIAQLVPGDPSRPFERAAVVERHGAAVEQEAEQIRSVMLGDPATAKRLVRDAARTGDDVVGYAIDGPRSTSMRRMLRDAAGLAGDDAMADWRRTLRLTAERSSGLDAVVSVAQHARANARTILAMLDGLLGPTASERGQLHEIIIDAALRGLDDAVARVTPPDGPRLIAS